MEIVNINGNCIAVNPHKFVKFVTPLLKKYLCKICGGLMQNPVQTCRGILACQECYSNKIKSNPNICPIDKEPVENNDFFPDKSVSREIGKLECFCENNTYGCQWKGAYNDIDNHERNCKFVPIKCEECQKKVCSEDMEKHKKDDCEQRSIYCKYCLEEYKVKAEDKKLRHEQICSKRLVQCPFECNQELPRDKLFDHINQCEAVLKGEKCPYSFAGCKEIRENSILKHMEENELEHAKIIISQFVLVTRDYEDSKKVIEQLRDDLEQSEVDIKALNEKVKKLESEIEGLNSIKDSFNKHETEMKSVQETVNELAKNFEEQVKTYNQDEIMRRLSKVQRDSEETWRDNKVQQLQHFLEEFLETRSKLNDAFEKIDRLETEQALTSSNLCDVDIKVQLQEFASYTGRMVWKIDDVKRRMRQAVQGTVTALHSPPAFTHRFGYKFCTRLYLNGDGYGKGKSVSVFFVVMKSPYDDLLEWPFNKKITFRLINVEDEKRTHKENFITDKSSQSFRKPTKEMNVAAGCPNFLDLTRLEEGFIVDDSLFLETIVENVE